MPNFQEYYFILGICHLLSMSSCISNPILYGWLQAWELNTVTVCNTNRNFYCSCRYLVYYLFRYPFRCTKLFYIPYSSISRIFDLLPSLVWFYVVCFLNIIKFNGRSVLVLVCSVWFDLIKFKLPAFWLLIIMGYCLAMFAFMAVVFPKTHFYFPRKERSVLNTSKRNLILNQYSSMGVLKYQMFWTELLYRF